MPINENDTIQCEICGKTVLMKDSGNVSGFRTCSKCYNEHVKLYDKGKFNFFAVFENVKKNKGK